MANEYRSPIDTYVGSHVKLRRMELGWTREQLAKELEIGHNQVQKYEEGMNRMTAGRLHQIAVTLRVQPQYFFDGMPVEVGALDDPDAQDSVRTMTTENMQLLRALVRLSPREQRAVRKLVKTLAEDAGNAADASA